MKAAFFLNLIFSVALASAADVPVWSLTTSRFKEVKVNGLPLKKALFWEFPAWTQIETGNAEVMVFLPEQIYLKLNAYTHVRWNESALQLLSGRVYIKKLGDSFLLQIPSFFNFKVTTSDMVVGFDKSTKTSEFQILSKQQSIQIDSDDREIPAPEGTQLVFRPEYVDGEMAYDFLLNDRKIPKLMMEKSVLENSKRMEVDQWKAPLKTANITKRKVVQKAKADSSKYICKQPNGVLNACLFVKEASRCVRYTCNLNGTWSQRTEFEKNDFCPKARTVKECGWLGR